MFMGNEGERIAMIISQFCESKADFARKIGERPQTVSNWVSRGAGKNVLNKILGYFPEVNVNWLLTGEGEMTNQSPSSVQSNAHVVENPNYMNVPVVYIKARCGYLAGYEDREYIGSLPTMPVIVDRTYHGKYMIFEAEGDSMDDGTRNSICDGDKLLCREVRRDLWLPKLHINDWYFVIVHRTEGIAIKQITNQDEKGNITCHSLNEMFNDYTVNLDIKVVERNMRL